MKCRLPEPVNTHGNWTEILRLLVCIGCCLLLVAKSYKRDALRPVVRGSLEETGLARLSLGSQTILRYTLFRQPSGQNKEVPFTAKHPPYPPDDLKITTGS